MQHADCDLIDQIQCGCREDLAVLTLLGGQTAPSTANLGPGVGGNLDVIA